MMRKFFLFSIFFFILTIAQGQTVKKSHTKRLLISDWYLISGQSMQTAFSADTLKFHNLISLKSIIPITDPIRQKPDLAFESQKGELRFEFTFTHKVETLTNGTICIFGSDVQYGFWSIDKDNQKITLTLLDPIANTDDLKNWTVKEKITYTIISISITELILKKNTI